MVAAIAYQYGAKNSHALLVYTHGACMHRSIIDVRANQSARIHNMGPLAALLLGSPRKKPRHGGLRTAAGALGAAGVRNRSSRSRCARGRCFLKQLRQRGLPAARLCVGRRRGRCRGNDMRRDGQCQVARRIDALGEARCRPLPQRAVHRRAVRRLGRVEEAEAPAWTHAFVSAPPDHARQTPPDACPTGRSAALRNSPVHACAAQAAEYARSAGHGQSAQKRSTGGGQEAMRRTTGCRRRSTARSRRSRSGGCTAAAPPAPRRAAPSQ